MSDRVDVESRLKDIGLVLPDPPVPVGAYLAVRRSGCLLFVSGQFPLVDGKPRFLGKVGAELSIDEGKAAARLCAVNTLAQIRKFLGGWTGFEGIVRLIGYVAAAENFTGQAQVLDGASNFFTEVLGGRGAHARLAMGVSTLPLGVPIELEVIAEAAV